MRHFTLGFIFSKGLNNVWLIQKTQPGYLEGKINGVGGKLKEHESFLECMEREAWEEARYQGHWHQFAYINHYIPEPKTGICCYYSIIADPCRTPKQNASDEGIVMPYSVADLHKYAHVMLPHTSVLVMGALSHMREPLHLEISY